MKNPKISIVIPCYNEEPVLRETAKRLKKKLLDLNKTKEIDPDSKIIFIDDGSKDKTWEIIASLNKQDKVFQGIKLSRNRGHQNALFAGLMFAKNRADAVISMDADLQDDIEILNEMLKEYKNGAKIVHGVRSDRKTDNWFKKNTAIFFYKIMSILGVETIYNSADYRLMSQHALNELERYKEVNLFLRGIIPLLGFKTSVVKYERAKRFAGESKYPLKRMVDFAIDGITSFSVKPLRIIAAFGFFVSLASIFVAIYVLVMRVLGNTVEGWTFIMLSIWFIGGVQVLSLGIVGEYIGKIYNETKARPKYIIEKILDN
jgi:glycosyltransferase involved in cell wall biosynthesis